MMAVCVFILAAAVRAEVLDLDEARRKHGAVPTADLRTLKPSIMEGGHLPGKLGERREQLKLLKDMNLVGVDGVAAVERIKASLPSMKKVQVVPQDAMVTMDHDESRVRIYVDQVYYTTPPLHPSTTISEKH